MQACEDTGRIVTDTGQPWGKESHWRFASSWCEPEPVSSSSYRSIWATNRWGPPPDDEPERETATAEFRSWWGVDESAPVGTRGISQSLDREVPVVHAAKGDAGKRLDTANPTTIAVVLSL